TGNTHVCIHPITLRRRPATPSNSKATEQNELTSYTNMYQYKSPGKQKHNQTSLSLVMRAFNRERARLCTLGSSCCKRALVAARKEGMDNIMFTRERISPKMSSKSECRNNITAHSYCIRM